MTVPGDAAMLEDNVMPRVDQQLCFALYSTLHAAHKVYAPLLAAIGLTYPQYLVMLVLWEADDVTVKAIGERLHLDSGTLTPLLKRLEASGLLARARDPKDERQVRIKLTEKGRDMRRQARPIPEQMARAMGRSPDDLKAVRKELRRIRNALLGRKPERPEKGDKPEKIEKTAQRIGSF
jgi:DNA-binding MarR family transcriptional regulator